MVFGRPEQELLQLNEATLWSGGPVDTAVNPGAFDALGQVRKALDGGDYASAYALTRKMQARAGHPRQRRHFQDDPSSCKGMRYELILTSSSPSTFGCR